MSTSANSGKGAVPPLRVDMQIVCRCGETMDLGTNGEGAPSMRCLACGSRPDNGEIQLCLSAAIIEMSKFAKGFSEKIQVHPNLLKRA